MFFSCLIHLFVIVIESKHKIFPFNEKQKLFNPLCSLFTET